MKKYKHLLLITLVGSIVAGLFFIINQASEVKKNLKDSMTTILLDNKGEELIKLQTKWLSSDNVPELIATYIQKEKQVDNLAEMLYPSQTIKRLLTKRGLNTYLEKERYEVYLNKIYLDNGIVGFENAADYYFNKSLIKTTELEQIYLIYKSENIESENIQSDLEELLEKLSSKNYISKDKVGSYKSSIPVLLKDLHHKKTFAQSYVDLVSDQLKTIYNLQEGEIYRKGYTITTNLDRDLQQHLYNSFMEYKNFPDIESAIVEGGMVILESGTGKIAGLMGGREYQKSTINRSIDTTRQSASTFKPLIVYGPALEQGWKPEDMLKDTPLAFNGYEPKNHDRKFRGEVSLRESLIMSYNVPTAWLLYKIGMKNGLDYINKFDLFDIDPDDGYKLALGFTRVGTSPLAMAQAYTTFANNGEMV